MCSLQKTLQIRILLGKSFHLRYNLLLYDQYFVFVPLWHLPCQNNRENPAPAILMTPAPVKYWPRSDYERGEKEILLNFTMFLKFESSIPQNFDKVQHICYVSLQYLPSISQGISIYKCYRQMDRKHYVYTTLISFAQLC